MLTAMRVFASRLLGSFRRRRFDAGIEKEFQSHLQMLAERFVSQGMSKAEALRAAKQQFGGVAQVEEELRERSGLAFLDSLWADTRYALRQIRKSPVFAATAVLTLALGIGANTAIFSLTDALLLRSLPFDKSERVVTLDPAWGVKTYFKDLANGTTTLETAAKYESGNLNFEHNGNALRIPAAEVSGNFFRTFALAPIRGRYFKQKEGESDGAAVVIVGYELWQEHCGGDPGIVGQEIHLNGKPFTVIGVAPENFDFPDNAQVWLPLPPKIEDELFGGNAFTAFPFARLRARVTLDQARAELKAIARYESSQGGPTPRISIETLHRSLVGDVRPALFPLLGAVGFVLLIACANVANLLLARGTGRSREVAIRSALGANRLRLVRQFLLEGLLLSLSGGTVGLLFAAWAIQGASFLIPPRTAFATEVTLNGWVLAFTFGVAIFAGILAGLVPALQCTSRDASAALKEGKQYIHDGHGFRSHHRIRSLLGISEIALSLILVTGAVLFLRSFNRVLDVNLGFHAENVLTARLSLLSPKYKRDALSAAFFQEVLNRVGVLPGVQAAAFANAVPLARSTILAFFGLNVENSSGSVPKNLGALYTSVSPDYFRAMGIPLLKGRVFDPSDTVKSGRVAIISKALAEKGWPDQDPIGRRFAFAGEKEEYEVIGVVGDVRQFGQDEDVMPQVYFSLGAEPPNDAFLVIRASRNLTLPVASVREAVHAVDPSVPVASFDTMNQLISESVANRWFRTVLTSIFAALAIILALVGIHGVFSYTVAQRTHEIGIRMALGAHPRDIVRLVLGEGILLAVIGIAAGIVGAMALTRFLGSMLFEIRPTDPATFVGVAILLMIVTLGASYIPARRAMRVDPMVALRYE